MTVDIILGNNVDTKMWIDELRGNESEHIIVIDYESDEKLKEIDGINYMEPSYALTYIKKFDTKNFYKSVYAFPGMSGTMSSLYCKK
ncbi:hypothetical protein [Planococcus wigleyi]|uniref:Uncharacterized protein n=1 Tax=Planococcus wigleyi TaxID=2762216 RepID=A0ABR8WBV3_9BACL|nr:hypothetical protein [Planococcus wigleyi]MBD8014498.1 hypothetical protein [Planococcus wigleyi]